MSKTPDWIKKSLMGSTTMPQGTGRGGFSFLSPAGHHVHSPDGSCCGHDHDHHHDHAHDHDHSHCGQDGHVHDENCGHGVAAGPAGKGGKAG